MKLTKEQQEIVEENLPLVTFIAKKYFSKSDYTKNEDIIQEGIIAMIKAIPKYDSEKGKFSTFMYAHLDGHLKRYVYYKDRIIPIPHQKHLKKETIKKAETARNIFSLDYKYKDNSSGNDEYTLLESLPDSKTESMEEEVINKIILTDAIKNKLNWKERLVIIYRFYFDLNQTDIGRLVGVSQVHVHRLTQKALSKIKKYLID